MRYVALYILSFLLFTQCLRFIQIKGLNTLTVTAINYIVAGIVCVTYFSILGFPGLDTLEWKIWVSGFINGLLYFGYLMAILMGYRFVGVGITSASVGTSIIIPVVASWALWDELMPINRWIAVVLALFAIILMRPRQDVLSRNSLKGKFALLACFFCAGAVRTIHKYVNVMAAHEPQQLHVYQALLWISAAAGSASYVAFRKLPYRRLEILLGVVLGLFNTFTLLFTLLALSVVPAVIFFPTSLCSIIILNLLISWMLWRERLIKRQIFGIIIANAVLILVYWEPFLK